MDITLIRHTSIDIAKGICYGQMDVGLSQSFGAEAEAIKSKLNNPEFDVIFCSTLTRCRNLALNLFPNQHIIYDNRLKELNFGQWEGTEWDNIYKTHEGKAFFDNYIQTACPNGESYLDLINRITHFYLELSSQNKSNKVCIVTHGGPIRAFLHLVNGISPRKAFEHKIVYGEVLNLFKNE